MPVRYLLAGMGVAVCLVGAGYVRSRSVAAADFRTLSHSFGEVAEDANLQHRFVFTNRSSKPLAIDSIKTTCGCLAAASDDVVAPCSEGGVDVTLSTTGMKGPARRSQKVLVRFSDGSAVVLHTAATIVPEFEIQPDELQFSTSKPKRWQQRLAIKRLMLDETSFLSLEVKAPKGSVLSLQSVSRSRDALEYDVRVDGVHMPTTDDRLVVLDGNGTRAVVPIVFESDFDFHPASYFYVVEPTESTHLSTLSKQVFVVDSSRAFKVIGLKASLGIKDMATLKVLSDGSFSVALSRSPLKRTTSGIITVECEQSGRIFAFSLPFKIFSQGL